jgi:hypothetical protein
MEYPGSEKPKEEREVPTLVDIDTNVVVEKRIVPLLKNNDFKALKQLFNKIPVDVYGRVIAQLSKQENIDEGLFKFLRYLSS